MTDDDAQEMPPWLPTFKVGDRVRIALSPECPEPFYCKGGYDGNIGEIIDILQEGEVRDGYVMRIRGHGHCVHIQYNETGWSRSWFAWSELELLATDDAEAADTRRERP